MVLDNWSSFVFVTIPAQNSSGASVYNHITWSSFGNGSLSACRRLSWIDISAALRSVPQDSLRNSVVFNALLYLFSVLLYDFSNMSVSGCILQWQSEIELLIHLKKWENSQSFAALIGVAMLRIALYVPRIQITTASVDDPSTPFDLFSVEKVFLDDSHRFCSSHILKTFSTWFETLFLSFANCGVLYPCFDGAPHFIK